MTRLPIPPAPPDKNSGPELASPTVPEAEPVDGTTTGGPSPTTHTIPVLFLLTFGSGPWRATVTWNHTGPIGTTPPTLPPSLL